METQVDTSNRENTRDTVTVVVMGDEHVNVDVVYTPHATDDELIEAASEAASKRAEEVRQMGLASFFESDDEDDLEDCFEVYMSEWETEVYRALVEGRNELMREMESEIGDELISHWEWLHDGGTTTFELTRGQLKQPHGDEHYAPGWYWRHGPSDELPDPDEVARGPFPSRRAADHQRDCYLMGGLDWPEHATPEDVDRVAERLGYPRLAFWERGDTCGGARVFRLEDPYGPSWHWHWKAPGGELSRGFDTETDARADAMRAAAAG